MDMLFPSFRGSGTLPDFLLPIIYNLLRFKATGLEIVRNGEKQRKQQEKAESRQLNRKSCRLFSFFIA
jgi:hypothetical protein